VRVIGPILDAKMIRPVHDNYRGAEDLIQGKQNCPPRVGALAEYFSGNYLDEAAILKLARDKRCGTSRP
jgi:hypothetical protein